MSLAFDAMVFARAAHLGQARKYTGVPYFSHLVEVAGLVASVAGHGGYVSAEVMLAVAYLHDTVEDCGVTSLQLYDLFGPEVTAGVSQLTDLPMPGNRAARKAASCARLAKAPPWVQTIKCADLISNTASIVEHDPAFSVTYLAEKRHLLEVMTKADMRLWQIAMGLAIQSC